MSYTINNEFNVHKQAQAGQYIFFIKEHCGGNLWNMWLHG